MFDIPKLKSALIYLGLFSTCARLQVGLDKAKTKRAEQAAVLAACRKAKISPDSFRIQQELVS